MSGPGRASTGRVGGGQFPADRHRLLGDRQRLGRTAQQREQGAEVAHRPAPRHERRAQRGPRRNQARLRAELARIDTAERGLITELEAPRRPRPTQPPGLAGPASAPASPTCTPNAPASRPTLADLAAAAPPDNDPALLDLLPYRRRPVHPAPPTGSKKPCSPRSTSRPSTGTTRHQVTIWASLTDDTPRTIAALLGDPRTDSDTDPATPAQDTFSHSAPAPMARFRPTSMVALF